MRQCKYTIVVPSENNRDELCLYHTLNDHLIRVDQSGGERLDDLFGKLSAGRHFALSETEHDAAKILSEMGFVVPSDADETSAFDIWYEDVLQSRSSSFAATILTTMSCNLKCTYCYEQNVLSSSKFMSSDITERVSAWLLKSAVEKDIKKMNVIFFGGEPLLNCDAIESIGATVSERCSAQGIEWNSGIITNGTLLTGEVARLLARSGVKWAKVTVDGDREAHDRLRCYSNGKGTFDRIMENLAEAAPHLKLVIGGNVDRSNVDTVPRLLDRLAKAPWRSAIINVRFKPIAKTEAHHEMISKAACQLSAFTDEQVGWMIELRDEVKRRGLPEVCDPNVGPCDFFRPNTVAVGIDGALYPCGAFVGIPELVIGNAVTGEVTGFGREVYRMRAWKDSCRECAYLPVCAGGCRVPAWLEKRDLTATVCDRKFYDTMVPRYVAACDAGNRRGDIPKSMFI